MGLVVAYGLNTGLLPGHTGGSCLKSSLLSSEMRVDADKARVVQHHQQRTSKCPSTQLILSRDVDRRSSSGHGIGQGDQSASSDAPKMPEKTRLVPCLLVGALLMGRPSHMCLPKT